MKPTTQKNRLWRALALHSGLLVTAGSLALAPTVSFAETASAVQSYQIPAGNLSTALADFAKTSGLLLSVDGALLEGKTTQGLNGQFSVKQGLNQLLQGSQLKAHFDGDKRVTINSKDYAKSETTLSEITVMGDLQQNSPYLTEISSEDMERFQANSTKDVFTTDPSVTVGGGGTRQTQRLYLRGIEQSNLNVTIDGADQGRATHPGQGNLIQVDPSILKQVEVDTAPAADAGPGALGGAIRFTTVDAQDLLDPGESIGAKLSYGYGSASEYKNPIATVYTQFLDNIGIMAHYSSIKSEDYRMGNGEKNSNTAEDADDYLVKLSLLDQKGHTFKISAERNEIKGQRAWNNSSEIGYLNEYDKALANMKRIRNTVGINYLYESQNPLINPELKLNQSEIEFRRTSMDNQVSKATTDALKMNNQVRNFDLRNTAKFNFLKSENRLTIGFDYKDENSKGSFASPIEFGNSNLGLYVQNRTKINNLSLSIGLRHDSYDADQGFAKLKGDRFSPNISASYKAWNGFSIFGSYGEAVRAAGAIPVAYQALHLANPDAKYNGKTLDENPSAFKPETSVRKEYGFNYEAKNLISRDNIKFKLSIFDTKIDNLIGAEPPGGTNIYNLPEITSKGWEARADYQYQSKWMTALIYSDTKVEDKDGDFYISSSFQRNAANPGQRLVWDNKWNFTQSLLFGYTLTASADVKNSGELYRKGFVVHDIQMMWSPNILKGLELNLAVNNLFDETYSETTTLGDLENDEVVYEPGRDIRIQASYRF